MSKYTDDMPAQFLPKKPTMPTVQVRGGGGHKGATMTLVPKSQPQPQQESSS
jgi:hypothetical protein